jgi:hypothetical protein
MDEILSILRVIETIEMKKTRINKGLEVIRLLKENCSQVGCSSNKL